MKKAVLGRIVVYGLLAVALLYTYRFRIFEFVNNKFYDEYTMEELTVQQKLEDFNLFYFNMEKSVPFLDEVREIYGIDFRERYKYYEEKIRDTEDNFEFYCTIKAICKDIPSFHTDVCFPLYSSVSQINCYNSKKVVTALGRKSKIDAWTKIIEDAVKNYENVNMLRISYVSGKYLVDDLYLTDFYEQLRGYELIAIDGVNIDKYITQNISTYNLYYDYSFDKAYRETYILNDQIGDKVRVLWQDEKGEQFEQDMYIDYGSEVVSSYGYLFSVEQPKYVSGGYSIKMQRDDENQLEYIEVNDFLNADGMKLKGYLENSPYSTIVIDLRNNYGGNIEYAEKYIYPALYAKDTEQFYCWMVPDTDSNCAMTKNWKVRLAFGSQKDGRYYYYRTHNRYQGRAKQEKNVYYLVGPKTGSAADTYVAMIKENHLGTIVGDVTGGEGLGASYICDCMDNSSLIYVYYPSVSYDQENLDKIYGGTTPDYYVTRTIEEFRLRQYYMAEGAAWEYENQLKHDAVLKWVIENLDKD